MQYFTLPRWLLTYKTVPIVQAAIAFLSKDAGQTYILMLNEVMWMVNQMDHSLINPNQMRQYGIIIQDNLMSDESLCIIS